MCRIKLILIAFCLLTFSVFAASHAAVVYSDGETNSGCEDYVAYDRGEPDGWPPIVLSAPHGGVLRPSVIPDRDAGCLIAGQDRCEYTHTCAVKDFTR